MRKKDLTIESFTIIKGNSAVSVVPANDARRFSNGESALIYEIIKASLEINAKVHVHYKALTTFENIEDFKPGSTEYEF